MMEEGRERKRKKNEDIQARSGIKRTYLFTLLPKTTPQFFK